MRVWAIRPATWAQRLVGFALGLWCFAAVGLVLFLTASMAFGGVNCVAYVGDEELYGESRWSWSRLGTTCVYDTRQGRLVTQPDSEVWLVVLAVAVWLGATLIVRHRINQRHTSLT